MGYKYRPGWLKDMINQELRDTIALLREGKISVYDAMAKAWEFKKRGWWWQAMILFREIKKHKNRE